MSNHEGRLRADSAGTLHRDPNELRNAYTLHLHTTQGGEIHMTVARMNLNTRRYSFSTLPELNFPLDQPVHLGQAVHYLANLIDCDEETRAYTI